MTGILPIVHRELILASRRKETYWTRSCAAALVGGVLLAMVLTTNEPPSRVSFMIFWVLKVLTFAYCLFCGVRYTADALSRERRDGTLGLLFLTDLHGFDVVFGKLAITSLTAFFGLLAAIPLLGVPVMMGGVSVWEFWRVTLVLINTILFSLAIGLVVSAFGFHERNVLLETLLCLLLVTFGLPLCWESLNRFSGARWAEWLFLYPSPAYALKLSGSGLFAAVLSDFWPCMMTIASGSLGCVVAASMRLPRAFQESVGPSTGTQQQSTAYRATFGSESTRARLRTSLLPDQPYLWRVSRDRTMAQWTLLLTVVSIVFLFYTIEGLPFRGIGGPRAGPKPAVVFSWLALHWLIKFLLTIEACRPFSEDKHSGTLELILCTPLPPSNLLDAQRRRLQWLFVLPLGVACAANYLIASAISDRVLVTAFTLGIFTLLADCWALRWAGTHFSLACRSLTHAALSTVWRVMLPPWIALVVMVLAMMAGKVSDTSACSGLVLWAFGAVLFDACLVAHSRFELTAAFRRLAAG